MDLVRRSPFAVHRTPFTVHRGAGAERGWGHPDLTTTQTLNLNPFRTLRFLRLCGESPFDYTAGALARKTSETSACTRRLTLSISGLGEILTITDLDVGVLLLSATLPTGTSTSASGK